MEASSIAAAAACAGALAAWVAAGVGIWTLLAARRDSRSRTRPMVAAELREAPYVRAFQILVIRNHGPSVAFDVQVTFDPPIPDPEDPARSGTPTLKRRYAQPIPALTPGMELDNIWFAASPDGTGWKNDEPTPDRCEITIVCRDAEGQRYSDTYVIDTDILRARTHVESSTSPDARRTELVKATKGIETILGQRLPRPERG